LIIGPSNAAAPAPLRGAFPLVSLIAAVVLCRSGVECWSLIIGRVEEVKDSAMVFLVVESSVCDAAIVMDGWLQILYVCLRNKHMHRAGKLAPAHPCPSAPAPGSRLGLCPEILYDEGTKYRRRLARNSAFRFRPAPQSHRMRDRGRLLQHTSSTR
jgi:hypothetical protein